MSGLMLIETVQDVTCPWCFIGKRRLDRALSLMPGLEARRRWRSFQLDPGIGRGGTPFRLHIAQRLGGRSHAERLFEMIAKAGSAEGIAFDFAAISRIPNTRNAHRLIRYAQHAAERDEAPRQDDDVRTGRVVDCLFSAHFEAGLDIGAPETLAAIAERCELDGAAALSYLVSDRGNDAVAAEDRELRRRGFSAVPCTVVDGRLALAGAQAAECYVPLFQLAAEAARHRAESGAAPMSMRLSA